MAKPVKKTYIPLGRILVGIMIVAALVGGVYAAKAWANNQNNTGTLMKAPTTPTTATTTTATTPAPPADPTYDKAVSLILANLADAKRRADATQLCIPDQPLPTAVPSTTSAAEKMQYIESLAQIENNYLSEINSGNSQCATTTTVSNGGGTADRNASITGGGNPINPPAHVDPHVNPKPPYQGQTETQPYVSPQTGDWRK